MTTKYDSLSTSIPRKEPSTHTHTDHTRRAVSLTTPSPLAPFAFLTTPVVAPAATLSPILLAPHACLFPLARNSTLLVLPPGLNGGAYQHHSVSPTMVGADSSLGESPVPDLPMTSSAINVFVTGQPGVGKTSLVLNAVRKLPPDSVAGFYTLEARNPKTGEKIGLDIETFAGERAPLSRLRRGCGPKVGKYYFALEAFEKTVLPLLTPRKAIKLHVVDEVGRMELQSEEFKESLMSLLASPQVAVFGSLPACRFGHDLPFVEAIKKRPDTAILTLTKSNRDAAAVQVEDLLMNIVGSSAVNLPGSVMEFGSTGSSESLRKIGLDMLGGNEHLQHPFEEEPAEKRRKTSSEFLL